MAYRIDEVEGIGPSYKEKLNAVGIKTTDDLLDLCCGAKGRKETAEKSGITAKLLLTWSNLADLMRINGVGPQISELFEASGVDTVKELRRRNAENLATKMNEVNGEKNLTKAVMSTAKVQGFIDQAKEMEPKITH